MVTGKIYMYIHILIWDQEKRKAPIYQCNEVDDEQDVEPIKIKNEKQVVFIREKKKRRWMDD